MHGVATDLKGCSLVDPLPYRAFYRTVTETLSPVADLGQDKKEENGGTATSNGNGNASDAEKFDTLELRNRSA